MEPPLIFGPTMQGFDQPTYGFPHPPPSSIRTGTKTVAAGTQGEEKPCMEKAGRGVCTHTLRGNLGHMGFQPSRNKEGGGLEHSNACIFKPHKHLNNELV